MSRYSDAHLWSNLKGPGDARPTAMQIIEDYGKAGALVGKTLLITGISSGIGVPTAEALAATGATVFCAARSIDKGRQALGRTADLPNVRFVQLDVSSFTSVRACAAEVVSQTGGRLNMLINNAGVAAVEYNTSVDGFEMQLATNYLGPFLLFNLLKEALLAAATPEYPSRVINLASVVHHSTPVHLDDLNLKEQPDALLGYGHSKSAIIHMSTEIERRWGSQNLHAWAVHPGAVLGDEGSGLYASSGMDEDMVKNVASSLPAKYLKSAAQAGATTVWTAVSDEVLAENARGKYLEDCSVAKPMKETVAEDMFGYADWAYDFETAKKLWEVSEKLVGLSAAT